MLPVSVQYELNLLTLFKVLRLPLLLRCIVPTLPLLLLLPPRTMLPSAFSEDSAVTYI